MLKALIRSNSVFQICPSFDNYVEVPACLGNTAVWVPDHLNKVSIATKQVT